MSSVWKYSVSVDDTFSLSMPQNAQVLSVAVQGGNVCLWAEVDPTAPVETRRFRICGTGQQIPASEPRRFVGTFMLAHGRLVFHLFELDQSGKVEP